MIFGTSNKFNELSLKAGRLSVGFFVFYYAEWVQYKIFNALSRLDCVNRRGNIHEFDTSATN
jgi:hypothetical protein